MSDNNVLKLSRPSTFSDPLTEVLRSGARSLLARAVEAEVAAFVDGHSEARTEEGRRRLVRHSHLPEREIMTGIGPVAVRVPRVRDRTGQGADRIRFSSALLPPYGVDSGRGQAGERPGDLGNGNGRGPFAESQHSPSKTNPASAASSQFPSLHSPEPVPESPAGPLRRRLRACRKTGKSTLPEHKSRRQASQHR